MIERPPLLNILTHAILLAGLLLLLLPLYLVFVAASHSLDEILTVPPSFLPGDQLLVNLAAAWEKGHLGQRFVTTFVVALGVMTGKIVLSCITAFGIVFFDHRLKMPIFWAIFITLMLPLEVRIVPTYAVAANAFLPYQTLLDLTGITWAIQAVSGVQVHLEWNLLNSYAGLILPLVATATGTFLYRQFFLTIPEELVEAAKMDGSGPLRFLWDVLIPLSRTNIAALATIMFVYAWNQYLWPLLVVTDQSFSMIAVELGRLVPKFSATGGEVPKWHIAMAGTLIVMVPPILVVIVMQRWFVRGLINTDK